MRILAALLLLGLCGCANDTSGPLLTTAGLVAIGRLDACALGQRAGARPPQCRKARSP